MTAYDMRISDWSSDVCSSDLIARPGRHRLRARTLGRYLGRQCPGRSIAHGSSGSMATDRPGPSMLMGHSPWLLRKRTFAPRKIGRAHVRTPVTNAHLVCRLLLEKKKTQQKKPRGNQVKQ